MAEGSADSEFTVLRHRMVENQIRARGVADERVLAAMEKVPRHQFVPVSQQGSAYVDGPLPIGQGQTISQPYMVARMTELLRLRPTDRVLEVGTGSGYQAAVLGELAAEVWTIERHEDLAQRAAVLLKRLGYTNVHVVTGDGTLGIPEHAPYDGIIVTAGAPAVPPALRQQMAVGGRMVIPVHAGFSEDLLLIERLPDEPAVETAEAAAGAGKPTPAPTAGAPPPDRSAAGTDEAATPPAAGGRPRYRETSILGCTFVPLIGEQGYRR
jgi:protein-L-isoaspartate(D-aspartate) O-methyltransferase